MSVDNLIEDDGAPTIPLIPVGSDSLEAVTKDLPPGMDGWIKATGYNGKPGAVLLLPGAEPGGVTGALVGVENDGDIWSWGGAAQSLPPGTFRIEGDLSALRGAMTKMTLNYLMSSGVVGSTSTATKNTITVGGIHPDAVLHNALYYLTPLGTRFLRFLEESKSGQENSE